MKTIKILMLIALFSPFLVFANDSSAELAAGGLIFVKNPVIQMQSEELYLSPKKVQVRYRFFNKSDKPVKVMIAFPLPDIESYRYDKRFSILPVDDPANPVGFITRVNGQAINMSIHQQAIAKNKDQTDFLLKNKIPLSPYYSKTKDALQKFPEAKWPKLEALGLIWTEEYDAGQGMKKEAQPAWTLKTTYTWEQVFPPRKTLVIEHEYQPVVGLSVGTSIGLPYALHEKWYLDFIKKYCVSDALQKKLATRIKEGIPYYGEKRLSYILKTGANWAGPIGDFTLTIDKDNKNNLVSFCGKNVKKISDTQFQIKETNFLPRHNLHLLFLIPQSH